MGCPVPSEGKYGQNFKLIIYFFYFSANGTTFPDTFKPKTICTPRAIIPQDFSSLG